MESPEIFDEIKKSCKEKNSDITSVIDDVHGARNISNHFKTVYEDLYKNKKASLLTLYLTSTIKLLTV